ncbi:MAG: hypothetical protein KGL39_58335 [Patescibacteria group bacterium]|nr:hypothetical protein [Patescibacteria group bacterium]
MAKTKTKPGDYIASWWNDDYNREEYVRGHVDGATALASIKREIEHGAGTDGQQLVDEPPPVRHAYMRCGFASEGLRSEGCEREFYISDTSSRGAAPVTVVKWADLCKPAPTTKPKQDQQTK